MQTNCEAKKGQVWMFNYRQSQPGMLRFGRVLNVRDTVKYPIHHSHACIFRTRYLITMSTPEGIRSFYGDKLVENARKLTFWERIKYSLGVL